MKEKCDNRIFLVSSNGSNIPLAVFTSGYLSRTVVPAAHAEQETSRAFSREYLNRIRRFTTEIAGREGGESERETLFPLPGCVRRLHTVSTCEREGERQKEREKERESRYRTSGLAFPLATKMLCRLITHRLLTSVERP